MQSDSKKASGKGKVKLCWACAMARAFADFAEAWACGCDSGAKTVRREVLPGLPGKGPERKEACLLS